ncbi:MAG TPA: response regulator [Vicinamibacterales bacterium]|nr:response regulator [Vicinamibacterales bacterium]
MPKLLLADDSVTIQRVIELTFADEDVQVVAVGDGQQAIERVRTERPDIVLADVGMPERDGYEVAAFIKNDPHLAHIPVLLLTGAFEPVDEVRARAVGCDGVLVKPFEPQMVISRVRELLAGTREPASTPPSRLVPSGEMLTSSQRVTGAASAFEATSGSLEAYFDRLDAALASKNAAAAAQAAQADAVAPPPVHRAPAPGPQPVPPPWRESEAHAPVARPAPVSESVPADVPESSLQDAFAALLAAEQQVAASPVPPRAAGLPSDVIDEIARRVIARMGDDSMRTAVLDAAERLVRDEIARIKNQS